MDEVCYKSSQDCQWGSGLIVLKVEQIDNSGLMLHQKA